MSVIASVVIAKGSLFFLERTESDGFESQPGGVDLQSQGDSVAVYKPPPDIFHVQARYHLRFCSCISDETEIICFDVFTMQEVGSSMKDRKGILKQHNMSWNSTNNYVNTWLH